MAISGLVSLFQLYRVQIKSNDAGTSIDINYSRLEKVRVKSLFCQFNKNNDNESQF